MSDCSVKTEIISKNMTLDPDANQVGVQQWGVKEDIEYMDIKGDAFIFHLLVPEMFIVDGMLELRTQKDAPADKIYFKIDVGGVPKYAEFTQKDIRTHYLGKLSNNQHVIEMVAKYPESLGDIKKLRKAIANGKTKLHFSII